MTKNLGLILLFMASSANATTLIKAELQPGFNPKPQTKTVTVDSSGQMQMEIFDFGTRQTTIKKLGQLSSDVITDLTTEINGISAKATLVDGQAGQPTCTDTPSLTVTVTVTAADGSVREVPVQRSAGCHTWHLDTYQAQRATQLASVLISF